MRRVANVTGTDIVRKFRALFAGVATAAAVSACSPADPSRVAKDELIALAPAGSTSALEFTWEGPGVAAKYRLEIRDASGAVVFSGETSERSMNIDATARSRFATMVDYSWTVSAIAIDGRVLDTSTPRSFTYQP